MVVTRCAPAHRRRVSEIGRPGRTRALLRELAGGARSGRRRNGEVVEVSGRVGPRPRSVAMAREGLDRAPKRAELRRAFISQLIDDQRYEEAVQQYAILSRALPGD